MSENVENNVANHEKGNDCEVDETLCEPSRISPIVSGAIGWGSQKWVN
jgi:hypothetical protein